MRIRRLVLALMFASLPVTLTASSAGATPPTGGCPPAFLGPLSFEAIIEMFPPPPGFPDPEGALANVDLNEDRNLCVRAHPNGVDIIVVDNVVR
jgi:hypothetical protein